jgi:F-type H+-transporting ATPase subunit g
MAVLCFLLQLATYLAFGAEVYAWFCIGEIVGRGGSLTGYDI